MCLASEKAFLARVHTDELFSGCVVWLINLHLPPPLAGSIICPSRSALCRGRLTSLCDIIQTPLPWPSVCV